MSINAIKLARAVQEYLQLREEKLSLLTKFKRRSKAFHDARWEIDRKIDLVEEEMERLAKEVLA